MRTYNLLATVLFLGLSALPVFAQMRGPEIMQKQQECRNAANDALGDLYQLNPALKTKIQHAAGYAAFEQISPKILIVGGGSGKGIAVNNQTGQITYMRVNDSLENVAFGLEQYAAVFIFETASAYADFITHVTRIHDPATLPKPSRSGPYPGAIRLAPNLWLYQIANHQFIAELNINGFEFSPYTDLNRGL